MLGVTHHGGDSSEELLGHGGRKPGVSGTKHPVPSVHTTVFVNERAAREEEEDQHNTSACCHGNTGQLMRHQSQYKSFSVLAAFFFSVATIRWCRGLSRCISLRSLGE